MRYPLRKSIFTILGSTVLCFQSFQSISQEHLPQRPEHKWLRLSEEQYHQGHFQLSLQSADRFFSLVDNNLPVISADEMARAKYYQTLALLKLGAVGAEDSATRLITSSNYAVYRQRVALALGQYFFRKEQLNKAIPYYESASIKNLTNQEIADSKFELAYAYFNSRQFEKAAPLFSAIKEVPGKYYIAGNYYYGLLAYNNGRYEEALTSFKRIDNEPQYKNIVPYYIAELYYFMGDRKKALEEAIRLIRREEKLFYNNELHLLAAQVLFEEQRYGEALPYFEHYYNLADKLRKEELYEMGYSYYRVNEWKNAIEMFQPLSNAQDSLGQTAMYLLGDCYLKSNDKQGARNAFGICADMPFNPGQREASLLLHGKLSYETGFNADAIRSFTTLITEFPQSSFRGEAKTFLSDVLIKSKRYEEAYGVLQDVAEKTPEYWRVWQKVTYGYAVQQMRAGDLANAKKLFTASLQQPIDETIEAAALFWRGDIAHRQHKPGEVITDLQLFVSKVVNRAKLSALSPQATLANGYLNLGYAALELEDYQSAQKFFSSARQGVDPGSAIAVNAAVREADAAFMQKNFTEAGSLYDKIIASNTEESDYALLQKGILLGVQGKPEEKALLLQRLIAKTPVSKYSNDARIELAATYIEDNKYRQAIALLDPLTTQNQARNYAAKAWMKIGFAYQEMDSTNRAIDAYTNVIAGFPAAEERATALESLRSLYIETNQPEAYTRLVSQYNLPAVGSESMDSTYYATAEAQIANGRWSNAKATLASYLTKYPNGLFTTHAHYYKAESHFQLKEYDSALAAYDAVFLLPWNEFSESSAKKAAEIAYSMGNYNRAATYFGLLRNSAMSQENLQLAFSGMMRSHYRSNQFELAARYADTLLALPVLEENVSNEVQLFKARSLQQDNKPNEALTIYQQLEIASNENIAAEARFRIAEIYLDQNKLKEAEAAAANALKLNAGNEHWSIKSYMLIADILIRQKDYFNAKATLQSIVKNTKNAAIKKEALQKLEEVKKLEKQKSKLKEN